MNFPLFRPLSTPDPVAAKIAHDKPNAQQSIVQACTDHLRLRSHHQPVTVICIGTDRSTGDCLGPLVGSRLTRYSSNQYATLGTLSNPVHAMNLQDTLDQLHLQHPDSFIIAIDACLGQSSSVGHIQVQSGPVRPGAGVNKQLPPVGDMHITGIVNIGGFMEYFVLQNTRLHLVMSMADMIADSLHDSLLRANPST
ncbi:spore protease YyaC [Paenibacillus sp. UMB4589-SE434]|uniref:spore protease YyaC n=1 Tax=Paenibacillus sp. UMB4589-SE434 TaxID=3046314 RepID=UPI00254F08D0|nr:spore protease YyaC [Paenibacillus sp. UMB4589-SE434]MDK8181236.1 spore protease YyaC [Paenibacillus sp. UMB4589-SE434]